MDTEKARRKELIEAINHDFSCFEEVTLRHATFQRRTIRADVVAVPQDPRFSGYAFAFEVKNPDEMWDIDPWCKAIKQASDYVCAAIEPGQKGLEMFSGRRIAVSFIFPAPPYDRYGQTKDGNGVIREASIGHAAGALQLALHFRVGGARWRYHQNGKHLEFSMGPNSIWHSSRSFFPSCVGLITRKRSLGSQKIDVMNELGGYPA
jgi:hypothetical protein